MKHLKKMFDENYTRMPHAVLKKSWKQYPTKKQLYGHFPPISQTIQDEQDMLTQLGKQKQTYKRCSSVDT